MYDIDPMPLFRGLGIILFFLVILIVLVFIKASRPIKSNTDYGKAYKMELYVNDSNYVDTIFYYRKKDLK